MAINNLGTVRPGSTLVIPFSTYDSNDPSKSITTTELDVGAISVYKDGSATKRASTSGEGIDIDVETIVGTHWITIDLSDNAAAGFYAAGSRYVVIVDGLVIDAATAMSAAVATFDIGYPNAIINTTVASVTSQTQFILAVGPAEADVLIGCKLLFHDVASAVQVAYAYVTDYIVTTKEVICTDPVGFTFVATDNVSVFLPDNVHAVQGTTQTAGDIPALVQTADTAIDALVTTVGVAGAGLGDLGGMATAMIAEVKAAVADYMTDIHLDHLMAVDAADVVVDDSAIAQLAATAGDWSDFAKADDSLQAIGDRLVVTDTAVDQAVTDIAALNDVSTAQVNTEVDNAIVTYGLDHLVFTSVAGADVADDSIIAFLVDDAATADWDNYDNTTASLEALNVDLDAIPTTAMRGTDNAALASVVGALNDAAAADEVTTADTLVQYVKQLINILVGGPGVVTLKAAAAPASGVSLSEMIRAIYDDTNSLDGTKIPNTISLANINAEVDTALGTTTIAELSQGVPAKNPTVLTALMLMYMALRNKTDVATVATDTLEIHNDAGTRIAQKLLSDDGADYSEAKMTSGA